MKITNQFEDSSSTAFISNDDFSDLINAFDALKAQLSTDEDTTADYLENKFVTDDGFQLGYFLSSKGKASWYLRLEPMGASAQFFSNKVDDLEE